MKLDGKLVKSIFIGYYTQTKAYKRFNIVTGMMFISGNVAFHKDATWEWRVDDAPSQGVPLICLEDATPNHTTTPSKSLHSYSPHPSFNAVGTSSPCNSPFTNSKISTESPPTRYKSLQEFHGTCTFALIVSDPCSYEEATDKGEWEKAMRDKINSIKKNHALELTRLLDGKITIGPKWIIKTKYFSYGNAHKRKVTYRNKE